MPFEKRKIPKQERSKATLEAILEAATQILERDGFERLTTTRVAERAGVSVGSLYQYFPNKEALFAGLIDKYSSLFVDAFEKALLERQPASLEDAVDAILWVAISSGRISPKLHRALDYHAPLVGRSEQTNQTSMQVANIIAGILETYRDEIASGIDIAIAANVVETVLEAMVHRLILNHPLGLEEDLLLGEAKCLILGYLHRR